MSLQQHTNKAKKITSIESTNTLSSKQLFEKDTFWPVTELEKSRRMNNTHGSVQAFNVTTRYRSIIHTPQKIFTSQLFYSFTSNEIAQLANTQSIGPSLHINKWEYT